MASDILGCPDEILLEVFSYLNDDCLTTMPTNEYPGYKLPERVDRALLFELRRVCRRFERLISQTAFSVLRLAHSLEHTQTLVNKIVNRRSEPLLKYLQHVTITTRGMIPKAFVFKSGTISCEDESLIGDPLEDPFMQEGLAVRQWAKLIYIEFSKLLIALPASVDTITIRDVGSELRGIFKIPEIYEWFFISMGAALSHFALQNGSKIRELNFHSSRLDFIHCLWIDTKHYDVHEVFDRGVTEVFNGERPVSKRLKPEFMEYVETFTIVSRNIRRWDDWVLAALKTLRHLDSTLTTFSLRLPCSLTGYTGALGVFNVNNLVNLTLEGLTSFDHSLLFLCKRMLKMARLHLYTCDIGHQSFRESPTSENEENSEWHIYDDISNLFWSHIFDTLKELQDLVEFEAQNISYNVIRRQFGALPGQKFWIFTEHYQDFASFSGLRDMLIQRRRKLGLVENHWLSYVCLDERWATDDTQAAPTIDREFPGLLVSELRAMPKYSSLMKNFGIFDIDFSTSPDTESDTNLSDNSDSDNEDEDEDEDEGEDKTSDLNDS